MSSPPLNDKLGRLLTRKSVVSVDVVDEGIYITVLGIFCENKTTNSIWVTPAMKKMQEFEARTHQITKVVKKRTFMST